MDRRAVIFGQRPTLLSILRIGLSPILKRLIVQLRELCSQRVGLVLTLKMSTADKPLPSPDDQKNLSPTKGHVDEVSSLSAGDSFEGYVIDKAMEKRILRKFDVIILPTVALMYLFKYVERTTISTGCPLTFSQFHRQE